MKTSKFQLNRCEKLPILYFIDKVYITENDLSMFFKIPKQEAEEWITDNLRKSETLYINKLYWIDVSTINVYYFYKFLIPTKTELKALYFAQKKTLYKRNSILFSLYQSLNDQLNHFEYTLEIMQKHNVPGKLVGPISLSASFFNYLKKLQTITILEKFYLYYRYCIEEKNKHKPSFFTHSFDVFRNKYARFCKLGLDIFIHGNLENTNASKPFTVEEGNYILNEYGSGVKNRFRQIARGINTERERLGRELVSNGKIISFIKGHLEYGERYLEREGTEGVEKAMFHAFRATTNEPGNVYQIDGARFNIPYLNDQGQVALMILIAIIDVFSKKIVAYTLAKTESFESYHKLIVHTVNSTGFLPAEIVMDNLPSLNSEKSVTFFEKLENIGVNIRKHSKRVPQDKAQIENFFKTFGELYLKKVFGYLGDGIKSRDRDGRANRDLQISYRKKANIRNLTHLELLLEEKIQEYNRTYNYKNSHPDILFRDTKPNKAIILTSDLMPMITFQQKSWTVRKTGFEFSDNGHKYQYLLAPIHKDFLLKYLNRTVIVRYSPKNKEQIYIYDSEDSLKYLFALKIHKPLPIALVDHSEQDKIDWAEQRRSNGQMKKMLLGIAKRNRVIPIDVALEGASTKEDLNSAQESFILHHSESNSKVVEVNRLFNIKGTCKIL